jgi:hypothetical protein
MRCQSCNKLLTAYESTLKNAMTYKYFDLCKTCFEDIKPFVAVIDRKDLITEQDLDTIDCDDMDTGVSLEDDDLLYSYHDTMKFSGEDYDV